MDKAGVSKSILSVTSPGTHFALGEDKPARDLARRCNVFASDVKKRNPARFGYWANLPLPDIEGSLAEIAYAFDNLNPDGVALLTNHHGIYLGDESFDPVFAELNRRKATVFIHPTIPCMQHGDTLIRATPLKGFPPGIFEYFFEEVRVLLNLIQSKTINKFPDVTFIIPHAGGAFPPIIERFSSFGKWVFGGKEELTSDEIKAVLQKQFYFDLSGFPLPDQIHGLLRFVDPSRLLFGSDYPYIREDTGLMLAKKIDDELSTIIEKAEDREAVFRGNAERLLGSK